MLVIHDYPWLYPSICPFSMICSINKLLFLLGSPSQKIFKKQKTLQEWEAMVRQDSPPVATVTPPVAPAAPAPPVTGPMAQNPMAFQAELLVQRVVDVEDAFVWAVFLNHFVEFSEILGCPNLEVFVRSIYGICSDSRCVHRKGTISAVIAKGDWATSISRQL